MANIPGWIGGRKAKTWMANFVFKCKYLDSAPDFRSELHVEFAFRVRKTSARSVNVPPFLCYLRRIDGRKASAYTPIVLSRMMYFVIDPNFLTELNVGFGLEFVKPRIVRTDGDYFRPDWR